ncbi:MAG: STAS domain-containing protein [Pyrinomonadaceae bacterium]
MSNLSITERNVRGVSVVDLAGKITLGESNRNLHEAIRRLVAEGKVHVLLNLAKVTSIDSSGLGEIVAGFSTVLAAGGSLKLINLPTRLGDLMTITKLYTVFEIYDSEAAGVEAFEKPAVATAEGFDPNFAAAGRAGSSLL